MNKLDQDSINQLRQERQLASRLRDAIGFCKQELEIKSNMDITLSYEERVNFEKCLTENYLMKHGFDYFGKRDFIYVDLYGTKEVNKLITNKLDFE